MKYTPLVAGGQGRSGRSLRSDIGGFGWLVIVLVALLVYVGAQ